MRSLIFLSVLALGSASMEKKGKCVVDGGEAASDLMDAALFIWGATKRCGVKTKEVKCEIDIASAVQSLSSMINTILKVVDRCGHDFDAGCGRAATRLTKAMAGISSASGGIKQKCSDPNWAPPASAGGVGVGSALVGTSQALAGTAWSHGASALCVLDIKNSAKNMLKTIKYMVKIDKKCHHKHGKKCAKNSLKVAGALAGLGEYIAAAVGDCSVLNKQAHSAECAQESIMLVHHVTKIAEAGVELSKECKDKAPPPPPVKARAGGDDVTVYTEVYPRRYEQDAEDEDDKKKHDDEAVSYTNLALGASLPLAAVVSFAAGKFYAGRQSNEAREFMSDNE